MSNIILSTPANPIVLTSQCDKIIRIANSGSEIVISLAGSQGIQGPAGPAGGDSWNAYAVNKVEYTGVDTVIVSGLVKECLDGASTIYRFITTAVNVRGYPTEDSFYEDFDGTNLTNLIVTRGV